MCRREFIPQVDFLKYLGITYDGTLNWKSHVEKVASKATQALGWLRMRSVADDSGCEDIQ